MNLEVQSESGYLPTKKLHSGTEKWMDDTETDSREEFWNITKI